MSTKPGRPPLGQRGVVSLSIHKNNQARRRAKQYRQEIADCARWAVRNFEAPLSGYAVVMWTAKGEGIAFWEGAERLGPVFLENHVATILRRSVARKVTESQLNPDNPDDAS